MYITSEPSSYSPDWYSINTDQRLDDFYDGICRTDESRNEPLKVSLENDELTILDTHFNHKVSISFNRTLRVPEDDHTYNLPALFGRFPIASVDDVHGSLPEPIAQKGGVIFPMRPREAVSIGTCSPKAARVRFRPPFVGYSPTPVLGYPGQPTEPKFAMRILCGGVNAVSCIPEDKQSEYKQSKDQPQNYIVAPTQKRLDGFMATATHRYTQSKMPSSSEEKVRQFVTMPTSQRYTVEEQTTGIAALNGFQIIVAPRYAGHLPQFHTRKGHRLPVGCGKTTPNRRSWRRGTGCYLFRTGT